MKGYEFQRALDAIGLSQRKAAKFLGVCERSVRNWVADTTPIPNPTALLLLTMVKFQIPPDDVPRG